MSKLELVTTIVSEPVYRSGNGSRQICRVVQGSHRWAQGCTKKGGKSGAQQQVDNIAHSPRWSPGTLGAHCSCCLVWSGALGGVFWYWGT